MSSDKVIIDTKVSVIEGYIETCDRIIADLEGENGLQEFEAVDREINYNLGGEYKEAFSDSLSETKMSYLDSISNV